ncbi:MAG TPA: hypothetical protein VGV59_19385 [Pyrinomonadaceae bacterium]|nr:hypothetical protein [Pyrinomonadaceae bacterium]
MSWWDLDDGNVSGDAPADSMRAALDAVAAARTAQGRPLPTLAELLSGFTQALKTFEETSSNETHDASRDDAHEDGDAHPPVRQISAHLVGQSEPVTVAPDADADPQLLDAFARAFAEIREQYHERWERNPRRPELLEALSFILGYRPDRFLSDAQQLNILDLTID